MCEYRAKSVSPLVSIGKPDLTFARFQLPDFHSCQLPAQLPKHLSPISNHLRSLTAAVWRVRYSFRLLWFSLFVCINFVLGWKTWQSAIHYSASVPSQAFSPRLNSASPTCSQSHFSAWLAGIAPPLSILRHPRGAVRLRLIRSDSSKQTLTPAIGLPTAGPTASSGTALFSRSVIKTCADLD